MQRLVLNGTWEIVERPLSDGPDCFQQVLTAPPTLTGQVPGDVNDSLVQAGRLPEPLTGLNFRQFGWVEQRSWWFRKRFVLPPAAAAATACELALDGLDIHADIWLNGHYLGHHLSAFHPFVREVQPQLAPASENVLLVRLTCGLERVPADTASWGAGYDLTKFVPTEGPRGYPERGDGRRIYLRKPAYTWGWDWGPHLATCGLTGDAELRFLGTNEIRALDLRTELRPGRALVRAGVALQRLTLYGSAFADVSVTLTDVAGASFTGSVRGVFMPSGDSTVEVEIVVPKPRLWWPNGAGEAHLYQVTASVAIDGQNLDYGPLAHGLRTVALDNEPGRFAFRVNGQPVFAKGGNWIPCDALYGRITDAKLETLVAEAAAANFNILRVWGGGRFERDAFFAACDRHGIMVWHDFMSACAPLPAHLDWFDQEFRREAEYQLRRLRSHACLALWCGNNEVAGLMKWFKFPNADFRTDPAWHLYYQTLPELARRLSPQIPYWPSSPYGGKEFNDPRVGDDHHWVVMWPDNKFWSDPDYWDRPEIPVFNSEYGYGGPCSRESTGQYLGTSQPDLFSEAGRQHTNTFYDIPRINFSIGEHYRDPEGLSLDDYILLGGLCQGLNLGYSLESLRANAHSHGGIFWMYDDCWGENGWTIVDYYLRRKVSFYQVRRSLAPRRLLWRPGGLAFGGQPGEALLLGLNEAPARWHGTLRCGYVSFDGRERHLRPCRFALSGRDRQVLLTLPLPTPEQLRRGTLVALPTPGPEAQPAVFRHGRFRQLAVPPPRVEILSARRADQDLLVTLRSATFAHAVHFAIGADYRLDDCYFDLVPDEPRSVRIYGGAALDPARLEVRALPR